MSRLDMLRHFGEDGKSSRPLIDTFFEELVADAEDPVLRGAGRYYLATGLLEAVNVFGLSPEDRTARRQEALDAAEGLSAGVEDEELPEARLAAMTFADAEAQLIQTIRHATVGSTPPELMGTTLDGGRGGSVGLQGRVVSSTSGRPGANRASRRCRNSVNWSPICRRIGSPAGHQRGREARNRDGVPGGRADALVELACRDGERGSHRPWTSVRTPPTY